MRLLILASLAALWGCAEVAPEELALQLEEAQACSPAERCVFSIKLDCMCPQPVTEAKAQELEETVTDPSCNGSLALCVALENPRCENGRCVADRL